MKKTSLRDAYPLSPMQSGFLFQSLYSPNSDAYFVQSVFELEGRIDISALKKAWQKISDHHPILRTGFGWENSKIPFQYVLESVDVPFIEYDWQESEGKKEQNKRLQAFIQEDRKTGFDLNKAPLFRLTLIHCATDKHYLIWSQHHILTDGWSTPIILGDVFKAYEALSQGIDVHFKTPRPYRDYIAWLQKQNLDEAKAFWKEALASLESPTKLSFKSIIKENKEKDYDTYSVALSLEETEEIKRFAQDHELTLNTVLQGAVGIILQTYTQQQEVVMGVTISGRSIDLPGVEEMVGLFINTLPLKIATHPEENTLTFLKNLQEQTQRLNEYAYTPLAQIQSWSEINQSLFDVIFVFENYPLDEEVHNAISGFSIRGVQGIVRTEYPLTISVGPGQLLYFSLSYQTEHFTEELIKKLSDHIKQTLRGMIHNSKENPQTLPFLTPREQHQLLIEWNDTSTSYPEDKTIHQLFEEQVDKTPNNTAVIFEDQELTYKELNERANQLAHHLRSLGVGSDTLVAIAVERSLEMIIGLLGILKAGGAYVPLDPSYPQERLQFMLEDTNASVLITQYHLQETFKEYSGKIAALTLNPETNELFIEEFNVLMKDSLPHSKQADLFPPKAFFTTPSAKEISLRESASNRNTHDATKSFNDKGNNSASEQLINLSEYSSENPSVITSPNNLAYVIYTSGSTGNPKGVMVGHRNLLNYSQDIIKQVYKDLPLKFAHLSTFSADLGNTSLYTSILSGSELHLLKEKYIFDSHLLSTYIIQHKIDFFKTVPSHFASLSIGLQNSHVFPQRYLFLGGETLENDLLLRTTHNKTLLKQDKAKHINVYNHYGPTEATVGCCIFKIEENTTSFSGSVPIGRPISNTQIYILDSCMNSVSVGVSGEIYIGGAGLARGYLNRPELTAERFIPNPFVNNNIEAEIYNFSAVVKRKLVGLHETLSPYIPGLNSLQSSNLRLYRTGDLARYLPDGNIEFLGRIDDQVKLRGFRIEPREIESVLSSHGDVKQTVAIVREDKPGDKKLVAYVVSGEFTPSNTELKEFLSEKLPDYMVPTFFVYLNQIPLTPSGKIDRKALPAPDLSLQRLADEFVAPQSQIEQELCSIWTEVLRVEKISIHDNFFRIGGDSIVSIQLVSKARLKGFYFTVKDVFNHPTIAGLISITKKEEDLLTVKPDQGMVSGEIPLTPIQHWFFNSNHSEPNHFNQTTLLLAQKKLDISFLNQTFSFLISHHDALRLKYLQDTQGKWKQISLKHEETPSLQEINLSHISSEDQLVQVIEEHTSLAQQSLDIQNGPIIRIVLFECGQARPQRLFIVIHHLVVDGVSWRILLEDLERIYDQFAKRETPAFSPKTHSYQQWAKALVEYASSKELKKEIPYWRQIEENTTALPFDYNHGPSIGSASRTLTISLTEEETSQLLYHVPKAYHTKINDILLTALVLAVGDWTQDYSLTLSLEGHGREDIIKDIDLSRTIGWFTSIFPVHLQIENPHDLGDVIKTVKETLKQIPHKGIGYSIISYLTHNNIDVPTFLKPSLRFNYLGQWDNVLQTQSLFAFSEESTGCSVSDKNALPYLLDIMSHLSNARLRFTFTYSKNHYRHHTIEKIKSFYLMRLRELINFCSKKQPSQINKIIVPFFNKGNAPIIFFIHPIGGKVFWYINLCKKLSPFFRSYGIESIFLNEEHSQIQSIEELAFLYTQCVLKIEKTGPFILCGWSFGGTIAYEMSKILTKTGHTVKANIIIDQSTYIDHDRYLKSIKEIEKNDNAFLSKNKKNEMICQYLHYRFLLKYKITSKVEKIIFFKTKEFDCLKDDKKHINKFPGWENYCNHFLEFTIGENHFSVLNEENSILLTLKIKEILGEN